MTAAPIHGPLTMPRLVGWALRHASRRGRILAGLVSVMLARVALEVLKPWPMVFLVDYILVQRALPESWRNLLDALPGPFTPGAMIVWSVGASVLLFVASWAVGLGHAYIYISLGQRMTYDLASDLLARLQQLSLRFHATQRVGDQVRRVTGDAACLSTILIDAVLPVGSALVSLAVMFAILWRLDPSMTALALVVLPWMAWGFRRYAGPMMDRSYAQQEAEGRVYEEVEQTLSSIPLAQAYGLESDQSRRFQAANHACLAATLNLTKAQIAFKIWIGLASAAGTGLVLWLGARSAMAGEFSVGSMILFLSYLGSLYMPIETIMYTSSTIQGAAGSARRVLEVLGAEPGVAEAPHAPLLRVREGRVLLREVTVGYESGRPVLRGLSLELHPGQILALVGPTGAGKSTLASLIPRFLDPWDGQVLVDGHDVRRVGLKSLREQIAVVLQEPFLFPLTVADNIAYGRPGASQGEIEAAARAARAHEFVARLPRGYDTVLGERGVTLSGGERQRLSIARALLKNAPILLMDEPTSALDAETEQAMLDALEVLMQHRTVLLIAHRLSTVRRAQRVVVLKDGTVAETGTVAELVAAGGVFAQWCHGQHTEKSNAHPDSPHANA